MKVAAVLINVLFALLLAAGGIIAHDLDTRIVKVENVKADVSELHWQIIAMHEQICELSDKVDDLREEVTHKRVYRRPCPSLP